MTSTSLIVIEDDEASMNVLCEFLQIKKLDIVGRGINGKKAMELYDSLRPDAVLMDVMMPDFQKNESKCHSSYDYSRYGRKY